MSHPVVHFEIQSNQADELHRFYSALFGWDINTDNPQEYGFVTTHEKGEIGIDGGISATPTGQKKVIFYVQSDDLNASLRKAVDQGGQVISPVTAIPGAATFALFADPEGNVVGLVDSRVHD